MDLIPPHPLNSAIIKVEGKILCTVETVAIRLKTPRQLAPSAE
jgi:hypothetical protein